MAAKQKARDVLVVPTYEAAQGGVKRAGRRILPGDVMVVSATAGPASIDGMSVGAIHVDERCWSGVLMPEWAEAVIEALLRGAAKA